MSTVLALITALGVVAALVSNTTNILRFVHDRRERAAQRRAERTRAEELGSALSPDSALTRARDALAHAGGRAASALEPAPVV